MLLDQLGAIDIDDLPARMLEARASGNPLSVDAWINSPNWSTTQTHGVRIADTFECALRSARRHYSDARGLY